MPVVERAAERGPVASFFFNLMHLWFYSQLACDLPPRLREDLGLPPELPRESDGFQTIDRSKGYTWR